MKCFRLTEMNRSCRNAVEPPPMVPTSKRERGAVYLAGVGRAASS